MKHQRTIRGYAVGDEEHVFTAILAEDGDRPLDDTLAVFPSKSGAELFARLFQHWDKEVIISEVLITILPPKKKRK